MLHGGNLHCMWHILYFGLFRLFMMLGKQKFARKQGLVLHIMDVITYLFFFCLSDM